MALLSAVPADHVRVVRLPFSAAILALAIFVLALAVLALAVASPDERVDLRRVASRPTKGSLSLSGLQEAPDLLSHRSVVLESGAVEGKVHLDVLRREALERTHLDFCRLGVRLDRRLCASRSA
eukprot:3807576-Pyramimonas_sp.AAC.1